MFPLNGHNVTWPQHRRASMSNSRQLWVNPHQFGLEGSDWIHNNELLVRLRTSLGLPSEGVLKMSPKIPHWGCSLNVFVIVLVFVFVVVFLLVRSCFLITLIKCLKGQKSQRLKVLSKCYYHCLGHCLCLCICLRRCLFVGQVMFSHRSDQMSQRPKVSKIALWMCLNVFVIVIVFVFAFVFVVVFLLVRSCFFMTPISFARFRFGLQGWKALNPTQSM